MCFLVVRALLGAGQASQPRTVAGETPILQPYSPCFPSAPQIDPTQSPEKHHLCLNPTTPPPPGFQEMCSLHSFVHTSTVKASTGASEILAWLPLQSPPIQPQHLNRIPSPSSPEFCEMYSLDSCL